MQSKALFTGSCLGLKISLRDSEPHLEKRAVSACASPVPDRQHRKRSSRAVPPVRRSPPRPATAHPHREWGSRRVARGARAGTPDPSSAFAASTSLERYLPRMPITQGRRVLFLRQPHSVIDRWRGSIVPTRPKQRLQKNRRRIPDSRPTFVDGRTNFLIRDSLRTRASTDLLTKLVEVTDRPTHSLERRPALRNEARYRLVVTRNHDLLAARYTIEEFSQAGLRFECRYLRHVNMTSY